MPLELTAVPTPLAGALHPPPWTPPRSWVIPTDEQGVLKAVGRQAAAAAAVSAAAPAARRVEVAAGAPEAGRAA